MAGNNSAPDVQIDDIIIGVAYSSLSLIALLFYITCLIVIKKDPELKIHSCFKLMFQLGICDLFNIAFQTYCGIVTATGWVYSVPKILNEILGSLLGMSWCVYISFLHIISLNRMIEMCLFHHAKQVLFSDKATKLWILATWLYGFCWFVLMMSPYAGFAYIPSIYTWYFDTSAPWYGTVVKLNWLMDIILLKGSIIYYMIIVLYLRFKFHASGDEAERQMRHKERLILKQAAVIGWYTLLWAQYWNLAPVLYGKGFKYAYALGNFFWVTNNPFTYLTLNKLDCFLKPWFLFVSVPIEHCFGLVHLIVSIDRLLSVFIPLQYGGFGRGYAYLMISTVFLPFLVISPYLYNLLSNDDSLVSQICVTALVYPAWYHKRSMAFGASCTIISVVLYIPTLIKLRKNNKIIAEQQIRKDQLAMMQQRKLTKTMVLSSVVLFCMAVVPSSTLIIMRVLGVRPSVVAIYAPLRGCFVQVGVGVNFFLFIMRHNNLKKAVQYLFKCKQLSEATMKQTANEQNNK